MIKKKGGFTLIKGPVWPYDVVVALGVTEKEFIEYMDRKFEDALTEKDKEGLGFTTKGRAVRLENNALVLWLKELPTTPEWYGHLAHEIFHIADMILDKAGLNHTNDSDEAWAYLIDWLTIEIYRRFKFGGPTRR